MKFDNIAYFLDIATRLKKISHSPESPHFFTASSLMQLQELIGSLTIANYPALIVIDKNDGRLNDFNSDNLLDVQFYQVVILIHADSQNIVSRKEAFNNSFDIFRSIIGKMSMDRMSDNRLALASEVYGLRNFNRSDVSYNSIGPILDNLYGLEFSFTLSEPVNTSFNPMDWHECKPEPEPYL